MSSHPIDFLLLSNNFDTPEMRKIWSEQNRLTQQINAEVTPVLAEGELGMTPQQATLSITELTNTSQLNTKDIVASSAQMRHSLMPVLIALQQQYGDAGEYIHYGATTQDIISTVTILQPVQTLKVIVHDSTAVANELKALAHEHQYTLMTGRTHDVQALPTTFGLKVAVWLDEFIRHLGRPTTIMPRLLAGNISGAISTYTTLGEVGPEVEYRTLACLNPSIPNTGWQAAHGRFPEYASVTVPISGTLGKIGSGLYNLVRTEINEVEGPFDSGKIGSTTMPHKRNPVTLEGPASLTQSLLHSASLIYQLMHVEHERDAMGRRTEWIALPEISVYLSAQLQSAQSILSGLTANKAHMFTNSQMQGGLLPSEEVMFEVGKKFGKQTAHHLVYEYAIQASEKRHTFKTVLLAHPVLAACIIKRDPDHWLDPAHYTGRAAQKVDDVTRFAEQPDRLTSAEGFEL